MANEGAGMAGNDIALLRKFLLKAAFDPDDERTYFGQHDPELEELDEKVCGGSGSRRGRPLTTSRGSRRATCAGARVLDSLGGRVRRLAESPPFDQIYMLVRFAMPLVPSPRARTVPRARRTVYVFFHCLDGPVPDLEAFVRGEARLVPAQQIYAISCSAARNAPSRRMICDWRSRSPLTTGSTSRLRIGTACSSSRARACWSLTTTTRSS